MKYILFGLTLLLPIIIAVVIHRWMIRRDIEKRDSVIKLLIFYGAFMFCCMVTYTSVVVSMTTDYFYSKLLYDYFIDRTDMLMQMGGMLVLSLCMPVLVTAVEYRFTQWVRFFMIALPVVLAAQWVGLIVKQLPETTLYFAARDTFLVVNMQPVVNEAFCFSALLPIAVFTVGGLIRNWWRKAKGLDHIKLSPVRWTAESTPERTAAAGPEGKGKFGARVVHDRLARLFRDDRPYYKKLVLAVFPAALFFLMFYVFQPAELYFSNAVEFPFYYQDFAWALIGKALVGILFSSLIISMLPRRFFDGALCLLAGIDLAGYIQMMAMNGILTSLKGLVPDWSVYRGQIILNAVLWILIMAVPFALYFIFKQRRRPILMIACGFLIAIQLVGSGSLLIQDAVHPVVKEQKTSGVVISGDDQLSVSTGHNIILILMDYFSNNYIAPIKAAYPDALDCMKDFTFYTNADSGYFSTFPSMEHIMTGYQYDNTVTMDEFNHKAWNFPYARDFYETLSGAGYRINLYNPHWPDADEAPYLTKCIANYESRGVASRSVNTKLLLDSMTTLSAYRFLPYALKIRTPIDMNVFYTVVSYHYNDEEKHLPLFNYNADMYEALEATGVTAKPWGGCFIHLYVSGTHFYVNDEACRRVRVSTLEETGKGCFVLLDTYFKELKRVGVYDDATIIITSDHGDNRDNPQVIFFVKQPGETHEAYAENSAPICHDDIIPTILASAGVDYHRFGRSVFDYQPGESRLRRVTMAAHDGNYPQVKVAHTMRSAFNNVFYVYKYQGDHTALEKAIAKGPDEILPIFYDTAW